MHEKIRAFIESAHLLSLSAIDARDSKEIGVYGASCYYTFFVPTLSLCFKSALDSKHIQLATRNPNLSVIIAKDSKHLAEIEGVQIKAYFRTSSKEEQSAYYTRFPFARLGNGAVFALEILYAKYTNNQLLQKEKLTYIKE